MRKKGERLSFVSQKEGRREKEKRRRGEIGEGRKGKEKGNLSKWTSDIDNRDLC